MESSTETQPDPTVPENLTLLVLAGGQGSRMGGKDKGLVEWHTRPMIDWIITSLGVLARQVVISCNRNAERYETYANRLVKDESSEFDGPLAGIAAASATITTPWCLIVPCDMPLLTPEAIAPLFEVARMKGPGLYAASEGEKLQPLVLLVAKDELKQLQRAYVEGERAMYRALKQNGATVVECSKPNAFCNLNSTDELSRYP